MTSDLERYQRQAVAALGHPESFRLLVESVRDYGIFMLSPDGLIVSWPPAAERITGFAPGEVIGKHVSCLHPPESDGVREAARELDIAARAGRCELEGWRIRRGRGPYWAFVVTTALRDEAGTLHGFAKVIRDDTETKKRETTRNQVIDELQRSNHDLEAFASVASHDLQEPLRKILTFADRLMVRFGAQLPEGADEYVGRVTSAARRMQQLIDALLTYSRVTSRPAAFAPVALGRIVEDVLGDLESRLATSGGRVEVGPLPTVDADAMQMRQLMQNLVANALKFHRPDQPPTVRISAEVDGDRCRLTVADDGIGFDPMYGERIFGVFQRLHGRGTYEGAGIGLAVCKRIVERHGGGIVATGVPDGGARFVVTLPLRHARAEKGSP